MLVPQCEGFAVVFLSAYLGGLGITHAFSTLIINSFKKLVHSPAFDHYDFLLPRDQIVGLLLDNSLDVEM